MINMKQGLYSWPFEDFGVATLLAQSYFGVKNEFVKKDIFQRSKDIFKIVNELLDLTEMDIVTHGNVNINKYREYLYNIAKKYVYVVGLSPINEPVQNSSSVIQIGTLKDKTTICFVSYKKHTYASTWLCKAVCYENPNAVNNKPQIILTYLAELITAYKGIKEMLNLKLRDKITVKLIKEKNPKDIMVSAVVLHSIMTSLILSYVYLNDNNFAHQYYDEIGHFVNKTSIYFS